MAFIAAVLVVSGCSAGDPETLASIHIAPTPSPSPKAPTPGELAAQAFYARVQGGKLTYHATLRGEVAGAISGLKVDGVIDVSGEDYSESVKYTFLRPPAVTVAVRSVGTRRWHREDRGPWEKLSASLGSNNPFADLKVPTGEPAIRTEHVGGKDLHHIVMTGGLVIAPELIPAGNLTNERVATTNLEVVVDDGGLPLTATWRLEGEGRVSGQLQSLRIDIDMAFSKVGSKMSIKAP
jgi:hypothetical protein